MITKTSNQVKKNDRLGIITNLIQKGGYSGGGEDVEMLSDLEYSVAGVDKDGKTLVWGTNETGCPPSPNKGRKVNEVGTLRQNFDPKSEYGRKKIHRIIK